MGRAIQSCSSVVTPVPTPDKQQGADLWEWKSLCTYHVFNGALVLTEVIFSQERKHEPLNGVNVQAHLNWFALLAWFRTSLGSQAVCPRRPAPLLAPGTVRVLCQVTRQALLNLDSWWLTPALELGLYGGGRAPKTPRVATSCTTFSRDAVLAQSPLFILFTCLPSAQLLGGRASACGTLGSALLSISIHEGFPHAPTLLLLGIRVWKVKAFQILTRSMSVFRTIVCVRAWQLPRVSL